jgi:ankyrin repeat protein
MPREDQFHSAHRLIKRGDIIAMRHALDAGLDPNLTNRFGWTLLMLAALHGRSDFAELLLSMGADPARKNKFDDSASSLATHKGFRHLASALEHAVVSHSTEV